MMGAVVPEVAPLQDLGSHLGVPAATSGHQGTPAGILWCRKALGGHMGSHYGSPWGTEHDGTRRGGTGLCWSSGVAGHVGDGGPAIKMLYSAHGVTGDEVSAAMALRGRRGA